MKFVKKYRWLVVIALFILIMLIVMNTRNEDTNQNDYSACKESVQEYLSTTNQDVKELQAKKGDTVVVDYIGRLESGEVFDTSVETVAKTCGKYSSGRNYDEHLKFTVGAQEMIPGFDAAVDGMKLGATTTVTLEPKDAYGEKNEDLIVTVPKDKIQGATAYEEGQVVMDPMGRRMTIVKVTDDEITVDANPELAGKTLIFDITLLEIK